MPQHHQIVGNVDNKNLKLEKMLYDFTLVSKTEESQE